MKVRSIKPAKEPVQQDEIGAALERAEQVPDGQREYDGAQALGQWVICIRTGSRERTLGGIIIPDAAQMPVWVVESVGDEVEKVIGRRLEKGQRLLFQNPSAQFVQDGRGYSFLRCTEIMAVLPAPEDRPKVVLAGDLQ
jgi:co-chaperonin GroES (HSP10)